MSGHKAGNYNPHDSKGRFTSGKQYSDIEPNKDKQINDNKKQIPETVFKKLNNSYRNRQQQTMDNIYNKITEKENDILPLLDDIDVNSVSQVENVAKDILDKLGVRGYGCYAMATTMAFIFKRKGTEYFIHNGNCAVKNKEIPKEQMNHTWVEANGKIYEFFRHYTKEQLGQHITMEKFKLKGAKK